MTGFLKIICGSRYGSMAIFLSIIVGMTLGLPSQILQLFSLLALFGLLFFKLSLRLAALTAIISWLMGLIFLDPFLHRLGDWVLGLMPNLFGFLSNIPVIAWFRLNNTMVIGPMTVIFILSPVCYFIARTFKQWIGETTKGDFRVLRLKVFVPFIAGMLGILIYIAIFLDLHLRWSLKKGLEFATGAEVNIGKLETSLKEASLTIRDIQMTDADFPKKNALSIENLKFDLSFYDLLRAKVVVENSSLDGVAFGTTRQKAGWVKPIPVAAKEETTSNPELERIKSQGMDAFKKLQDLAKGLDPTAELRKMNPEDFPSAKKFAELRLQIKSSQDGWQKSTESLPSSEDFKARLNQIKSIKAPSDLQDVARFQGEVEKIRSESKQDIEKVNGAYDKISGEMDGLSKSVSQLGDLAKSDIDFVLQALKLPQIDAKALAKELLEPMVGKYVAKALKYYGFVEPYLKSEKKTPSKPLRLSGISKSFPSRDSVPSFWWKKASISWFQPVVNEPLESGQSSDTLKGELLNLCSSQDVCGKPFQLNASGNLGTSDINGIKFQFEADHRASAAKDNLNTSVGAFSVPAIALSESEDLKLAIGPSKGRLDFTLLKEQDSLNIQLQIDLAEVKWNLSAKNILAEKILTQASTKLSSVDVKATARGTSVFKLDWDFASNLTREIEASFKETINKELGAARGRLEKEVKDRIANERKKIENEFNKLKSDLMTKINSKKAEAKAVLDEFEKRKSEGQAKVDAVANEAKAKVAAEKARLDAEKNKKVDETKSKVKDALKSKLPFK